MELPDNMESLSREEQYALFGHLMEQQDRPVPLKAATNAALMTARFLHFECPDCQERHEESAWLVNIRDAFRRMHSDDVSDVISVVEMMPIQQGLYSVMGVDKPSDQLLASLKVSISAYLTTKLDVFNLTTRPQELDIAHSASDVLVRRVIALTVGALQMDEARMGDEWVPAVKSWDGFDECYARIAETTKRQHDQVQAEGVARSVGIDLNWN